MVVSFGRSSFKLTEDTISIALESAIGGLCDELKVSLLRDRVFSFTVSSKQIGFLIHQTRSFSVKQFKCFFHLWGRGGPNWSREFASWQVECQQEWTLVCPYRRTVQMGMNAMRMAGKPKSVVRRNPVHPGRRIRFATIEKYTACKGYRYPLSAELIKDLTDGGYELSSPERIPDPPSPAAIWTNAEPSIKLVPAHSLVQSELPATLSCNGYVTVAEPEIHYAPLHPLPTTVPDSLVQQSDSLAAAAQNSVLNQPPNVDSNLDGSLGLGPQLGSDVSADGLHEFEAMIDDMVYKVWECGRCLSMGHKAFECANDIRCKACFSYGHIAKKCLSKNRKKSQIWVPKTASVVTGLLDSRNNPLLASSAVPPLQSPQKSI
jgi:hypothetical protein